MTTNITLLKVEDPFHFWGKEVLGPGVSQETIQFQELCEEIQEYCSSDQYIIEHVNNPVKGKMYLAQRPSDGKWYRARVLSNYQTAHGIKASCHLVDYADSFLVAINRLKEIPPNLKKFPSQAKPFRIHGVLPTTLHVTIEENQAELGPTDKWDIAAIEFFRNIVEDRSAQVDIHGIGPKETRFVTLYVNTPQGQVNVNEELLKNGFAVSVERDIDEVSEIGSLEGACSRPVTPRTYTPRISSPRSPARDEAEQSALDAVSPPWRPGVDTPPDRSASGEDKCGDVLLRHAAHDDDVALRIPRTSGSSPALGEAQEKVLEDRRGAVEKVKRDLERSTSEFSGGVRHGLEAYSGTNGETKDDTDHVKSNLEESKFSPSSVRGRSPSLGHGAEQSSSPDNVKRNPEGTKPSLPGGRGRGLAALVGASEVGRTRSPSPLSPPSPANSTSSNILKSDNLKKMLEKSVDTASRSTTSPQSSPSNESLKSLKLENPSQASISPLTSPSSQHLKTPPRSSFLPTNPSESPQPPLLTDSPKRSAQPSPSPPRPLAQSAAPRPGIYKPLLISGTTRQPFLKDVSVRPKEISPKEAPKPSHPGRSSPPSFLSPVSDPASERLPWKRKINGHTQHSPSSSDWNKMSSTSGQSDASEGESTAPVRAKPVTKSPSSIPSERAKIIEESLLNQLKSGTPRVKSPAGPDHHHGYDMGVVVHGERPPDPVTKLKNAPFPDVIKRVYEREANETDKGNVNISLLQAWAWPAVLRGRDLVGVAPRDTGNTLAYLLPVITQVLQQSVYSDLPPGNGPLVLILCTSWEHAKTVCVMCEKYVSTASKTINTIFLYGGNNEKQQEVQLVNGCQILISTLPCVLRMKERNLTNFNRLCHVVFDEANILFRDFIDEVKAMMQELLGVLRVDQRRSAPRQLLVFANEWTSAIGSFLRTYMTNQLVVITQKLEAAVYARVRQNIEMVDASQRTRVLLSKLQSGMLKGTKAIIFANDKKTAYELMKTLTTSSIYTLLATDDMPSDKVEQIKKEWYTHHRPDSIPILVMTNGAIQDIGITDAMYIIHYDFPSNKGHYGKRMGCMMRHFESQLKEKKRSSCQSLSFVSSDTLHVLSHMSELLFRSGQPLPSAFTREQIEQAKEERRKNKPFCYQLKSFGECRTRTACVSRHQIYGDIDEPGINHDYISLPKQGTVKLLITFIVNASNYYVRLLAHRHSQDHKVVPMTADYVKLTLDLQEWYTDPVNVVPQRPLQKGDVCGFRDHTGCYSRVRVKALVAQPKNALDSPAFAEVQFVDSGGQDEVSIEKLLRLPDHLRHVKFQAVEVFVCRVKPPDKDYSWNPRADNYMYDFLMNKELNGKIVLSLGNTLWLDPLVEHVQLEETKTTIDIHTRNEMIKQGCAVDNPLHIKNLLSLCKGKLSLPKDAPLTQVSKSVKLPAPARLNEDGPTQVYMSAIETPQHIYVQPVKSNYRLENLMQSLNHKMANVEPVHECQVAIGELCIAKCAIDDRWYRGRLMNEKEDERDIFFIDHGDMEWVHKGYVHPLPQQFTDLGPQAIQCSLVAIQPFNGQNWDEKAADEMWDMCVGETTKVAVTVEVDSSEISGQTGGYYYKVNMYNEIGGEKILISKRLIDAGLAKPTEDFMKVISPIEVTSSGDSIRELNKLCAQLYQVKSLQSQLGLVDKIDKLMTKESDKANLLEGGSIKALCQVLCNGRLKENTKELLVLSLLRVSQASASPRISREIASEGGLKSIHNVLMKTSDVDLKEDITIFIEEISSEKRTRDLFLAAGGINILHHLLDLENGYSVVRNVCDTLKNILFYNDVVRDTIPSELVSSLCNITTRTENTDILHRVLAVLANLAANRRNRGVMYRHDVIECACNIMWTVRDDKVVQQTVLLLKNLGADYDARQSMIDQDLSPCLSGCMISQSLSNQTKDECLTLMDMIDQHEIDAASLTQQQADHPSNELTIPKTHPKPQSNDSIQIAPFHGGGDASQPVEDDFDDMPLLEEDDIELTHCHPKILWSQHANSVLLSVQLQGVKNPTINVTTSSISFSAILDSVQYEFELDLFSRVDSSNFTSVCAGREFLITLYKESIGIKWTRLTQTKERIPYISVDFERWQDDEEMADHNSKRKAYIPKKTNYTLPEPGMEPSFESHSASEDEEDHSDFSGDEFDKAFEDFPTHSSRSDTDVGLSS